MGKRFSTADAYLNGALLREMLDDLPGALRDAEQAARVYREQGRTSGLGNATGRVRAPAATAAGAP